MNADGQDFKDVNLESRRQESEAQGGKAFILNSHWLIRSFCENLRPIWRNE
jgi:hypothetical protein